MLELEHAMLAEQFQILLDQERQAEKLYTDLAGQVTDPADRQEIQQISREKGRHVQLVNRLLEIVD